MGLDLGGEVKASFKAVLLFKPWGCERGCVWKEGWGWLSVQDKGEEGHEEEEASFKLA